MYAYNFEGRRYDVGDKLGFLQANIEFALKKDDLKIPFLNYLQTLKNKEVYINLCNEITASKENKNK